MMFVAVATEIAIATVVLWNDGSTVMAIATATVTASIVGDGLAAPADAPMLIAPGCAVTAAALTWAVTLSLTSFFVIAPAPLIVTPVPSSETPTVTAMATMVALTGTIDEASTSTALPFAFVVAPVISAVTSSSTVFVATATASAMPTLVPPSLTEIPTDAAPTPTVALALFAAETVSLPPAVTSAPFLIDASTVWSTSLMTTAAAIARGTATLLTGVAALIAMLTATAVALMVEPSVPRPAIATTSVAAPLVTLAASIWALAESLRLFPEPEPAPETETARSLWLTVNEMETATVTALMVPLVVA